MKKREGPFLSMIVPAYNEAGSLPFFFKRATECLNLARSHELISDYEILIVDDHSDDETLETIQASAHKNRNIRWIRLAKRSGSHVAIFAGLNECRGDVATYLAADLQDPPELIPELLAKWSKGYDVVWASRGKREGVSIFERMLSKIFYFLIKRMSHADFPPRGADFALLDAKVVRALLSSLGARPSLGGSIASLGFSQSQVPYTKGPRHAGRSKWTFSQRIRASIDAFVAFSFVPLRLMTYTGLIVALLGFAYAAFVIWVRMTSLEPVSGWASLMVAILVIGGIQMIMLGILGEYLWRNLEESRKKPLFFIESRSAKQTIPKSRSRKIETPPPTQQV